MFGRREKSGISPFRAVTVALAGTLGVGNIVGVASAIAMGGFGSLFWMWVSALCAMILKYAEIALAVSHRRSDGKGGFYGGAVWYIRDLFAGLRVDRLGKAVALIFAVFLLFDNLTTGCVVQINAAARSARSVCNIPELSVGIITAAVTSIVVLKGANSVSRLTNRLIPALSVAYIALSLAVIFIRRADVAGAFSQIFQSAFSFESAAGGAFGFLTCRALRFGTMRGLLSNEAGCGTSPTAHASANAKSPAEQGFWGIFEVFVDTILLCTLTALVIILNYDSVASLENDGIIMAIKAYSSTLGRWCEYPLALSVVVFGSATVLCRAHYGIECLRYLFGRHRRLPCLIYIAVFASVTVAGALAAPNAVWGYADLALGTMTLINVTVLLLMQNEVKRLTDSFFKNVPS